MKQEYLTRKKYEKPEVTVVKFAIERGLALSDGATNTDYQQGANWNLLGEINTNNYTGGNNWNLPSDESNTNDYTGGNNWGTI